MYERYCQLRDLKGFSNYRIAKECGITQAALSDWKNGKSTPNTEKLIKIAKLLGTSVEWLYTGENQSNNDSISSKYNSDPEFMLYIKRLWDLPPDSRQAIYKQIRFEEQEAKERRIESRKEA